jgi:regulatory protein YycH of two-component signal transduction system YycFG
MGWVNRANKYIVRDYPEQGVIPLDIIAQVDEEVKKPVAALPKEQLAQNTAKAVADTYQPLEFNQDLFMDPELVAEYVDPDRYEGTINETPLIS